jgi:hypothetical protein
MPGLVSGLKSAAQTVLRGEHAFVDAQEAFINGKGPGGKNSSSHQENISEPLGSRSGIKQWNHGLFAAELANSSIFPRDLSARGSKLTTPKDAPPALAEGTYHGTRIATTEMLQRIEAR